MQVSYFVLSKGVNMQRQRQLFRLETTVKHCIKKNGISNNIGEETEIFESELLKKIEWGTGKASFRNVSPSNPGENVVMRPLSKGDFHKGFMQLLSQLTGIGEVSEQQFSDQFDKMKGTSHTYYIVVLEDTEKSLIIGSASLIVEEKFIHSTGKRGRIEDVVVSDDYRGKQLGKLLVETLTLLGKSLDCYKVSLECKDENAGFYESFGFVKDAQHFMVQRFKTDN